MPQYAYPTGIDTESKYPGRRRVNRRMSPIERLADPKHHDWVAEQINARIQSSELEMQDFHSRWQVAERRFQAYLNLPKYEKMLRDMNESGKPPAPAIIVFPYQMASISTIVSYMMRTFCGRKPIFNLGFTSPGSAAAAPKMEIVLQRNADIAKLVAKMYQFFLDGQLYGLGVMRNVWIENKAQRTVWKPVSPAEQLLGANGMVPFTSERTVYEGNDIQNVDPFMFLPDPNVPMHKVNREGEFVFWRSFISRINLLTEQANGRISYLDRLEPMTGGRKETAWYDMSSRNLISQGSSHAGGDLRHKRSMSNIFMQDQGTINIIPADWGLGDQDTPQRFLFALGNRKQIIQCEALDNNHSMHPVVVSEPYTMGYSFGSPAIGDWIGPIQDIMSWFIDSHIYNVRAALSNMFIYDPSRVEIADLKRPGPAKLIRLKPTAIGQDVRSAIQQLPVQDVTRGHVADLQTFMMIGDTVSAVSENIRGTQRPGGRKTATEVRVSGEAALSRLGTLASLISAQSLTDLQEQMVLNIQQYQTLPVYLKLLGREAMSLIQPQDLSGEFIFPVHDGTLPLDRAAMVDVWEKVFGAMQKDPQLRAMYSLPRIFEHTAEMAGAVNISSFRTNVMPDPSQQPGMVPMNQVPDALPRPGGGRPQRPQLRGRGTPGSGTPTIPMPLRGMIPPPGTDRQAA